MKCMFWFFCVLPQTSTKWQGMFLTTLLQSPLSVLITWSALAKGRVLIFAFSTGQKKKNQLRSHPLWHLYYLILDLYSVGIDSWCTLPLYSMEKSGDAVHLIFRHPFLWNEVLKIWNWSYETSVTTMTKFPPKNLYFPIHWDIHRVTR